MEIHSLREWATAAELHRVVARPGHRDMEHVTSPLRSTSFTKQA